MMSPQSILVIGASGRTGGYLVKALAKKNTSKIYAFCRNPTTLKDETKKYCDGVVAGDALKATDIQNAIDQTNADVVMVAVANGDDTSRTELRTLSAQALVQVMMKPNYKHIRAVVISSHGAGGSRVKIGFGIGRFIEHHLRHIFRDHDGQEDAFLKSSKSVANRTMIVRPTALTDGESLGYNTGKVQVFGDLDKSPAIHFDREDLATWVVEQMYTEETIGFGSKPLNVAWIQDKAAATAAKKQMKIDAKKAIAA